LALSDELHFDSGRSLSGRSGHAP